VRVDGGDGVVVDVAQGQSARLECEPLVHERRGLEAAGDEQEGI
jgi:hypothetical protein